MSGVPRCVLGISAASREAVLKSNTMPTAAAWAYSGVRLRLRS